MAAGNQQQEIGKGAVVGQPRGQRVAFQVIDGQEGQPARKGDRLARHDAHHHPADQPGPAGRRDAVEIAVADAGALHRRRDQAVQRVQMAARRDLGHDAAIGAVLVELAQHQVGMHRAVVADHRGRGLVAGGLDSQNKHDAAL